MKTIFVFLSMLFATLSCMDGSAQSGRPDEAFNPQDTAAYIRYPVRSILYQPDGKIIAVGGDPYKHSVFARYHPNGSFDSSFVTGTSFDNELDAAALQPDGKIIAGGLISSYNDVPVGDVARINSDGSLDPDFHVPSHLLSRINAIVVQPDGRILIASDVLIRLMPDGSLDSSFGIVRSARWPNVFNSILLQPDGKIIAGGSELLRLNADGTPDAEFKTGSGFSASSVQSLALLPGGRIMAGGHFTTYQGRPANYLARLHPNGNLDSSFQSTDGIGYVSEILPQSDGKIIVGGYSGRYLERLHPDGGIDTSFRIGHAFGAIGGSGFAGDMVLALCQQADGQLLVGGEISLFHGNLRPQLLRLKASGELDSAFRIGSSVYGTVHALAVQADGKIIAGSPWSYFGVSQGGLTRLFPDGSLDSSFAPQVNWPVRSIVIQPDGRILIGGEFNQVNGRFISNIARLHPDGSLDTSFHTGIGFVSGWPATESSSVSEILLQNDGRIVVVGFFAAYNGRPCDRIVRLNGDGSVDTSFRFQPGQGHYFSGFVLLPDGRFAAVLNRWPPGNSADERVLMLDRNGNVEQDVWSVPGDQWRINRLFVQPDAKVLVTMYNHQTYTEKLTLRLLGDGSVDDAFTTVNEDVFAVQPDGKMLYHSPAGIGRLTRNGIPDPGFEISPPYSFYIYCSAFQPDDKILLGGIALDVYNTKVKNGLYRLKNCMVILQPGVPDTAHLGKFYQDTVFSAMPDSMLSVHVSDGSLPPGLSLDPVTGVISGTATIAGSFSFSIAASNGRCSDTYTYRLIVDTAGSEPGNHGLLVYPIPSHDFLHIDFGASAQGAYDLALHDMLGRLILKDMIHVTGQGQKVSYDIRAFSSGVYTLQVSNEAQMHVFKVERLAR